MEIPEFHIELYRRAKRNGNVVSYHYLAELIKRFCNSPSIAFCLRTIDEMEYLNLIEQVGNGKRKKEYVKLTNEEIKKRLTESKEFFFRVKEIKEELRKSAFPIDTA